MSSHPILGEIGSGLATRSGKRAPAVSPFPRSTPLLDTREIVGMEGQCASGEPIWLDLGTREIKVVERTRGVRTRTFYLHKRLIAILTFDWA